MSVITKLAAGILTTGLLLAGSSAALAVEPIASEAVISDIARVLITEADVATAHADFKQAQTDAQAAERQARIAALEAEKVAGDQANLVKGKEKQSAQADVQALRAVNHDALTALKAENDALVNAAKDAYQEIAAAYDAQQTALIEEPIVADEPVAIAEPAV